MNVEVTFPDNTQPHYLGIYEVGQGYGGPEEGGWWFECGDLVRVVICYSKDQAFAMRDRLREVYPVTKKRYSVLGGEDYDMFVTTDFPPDFFPEVKPHYE